MDQTIEAVTGRFPDRLDPFFAPGQTLHHVAFVAAGLDHMGEPG